jgi:hypothetical protein
MDKTNCLQKEAGAKKLFATTTTPKKIALTKCPSPPSRKIMVRPLYSGGLIFGGGAYIWNEVSVSTCGGLIHGGLIFGGGGGGLYSKVYGNRFEVGPFFDPCKEVVINQSGNTTWKVSKTVKAEWKFCTLELLE